MKGKPSIQCRSLDVDGWVTKISNSFAAALANLSFRAKALLGETGAASLFVNFLKATRHSRNLQAYMT
jgi:hypothetical protein